MALMPDQQLHNADWTKQSWDLPWRNVEDARAALEARGMSVAHFKTLPVYRLNVDRVPWLREL